ncbi:MAG: metal ABC transporter substrate-binding protein [Puniceicoccales bacterium]|jgi:ABC-type Zn uptake system ZnuABC Zn-binding protein ZnuA|nr:metal ABC transporter substrate-binding protein [Puniceicoccales bacterium]
MKLTVIKKLFCAVRTAAALIIAGSVAGSIAGNALAPAAGAAPLRVVATTPDLAALAVAVGGDDIALTTLARPHEDPHFVDARPSFLRALNRADLLITGGADLEDGWLPPLTRNARNGKILEGGTGRFDAGAHVKLRDVPAVLDRSQGDVHAHGNPHFLLDPANAARVATALAEKIGTIAGTAGDAPAGERVRARAKKFADTLAAKHADWRRRLAPYRDAGVVTYHRSYDYLLAAFDLRLTGTVEPKPGIEPSASHLLALAAQMKRDKVRLILAEPNRPARTCSRLATDAGATLLRLPIMPPTPDYLAFMEQNIRALETALKRPSTERV